LAAFARIRRNESDLADRRALEDFLLARCIERATEHGLPVKLHLGHLAGTSRPEFRWVAHHVADVIPLIHTHPSTTFVLVHAAWPQQEQLLSVAKHFPNAVVDLCWAWSLAPRSTTDFVQRFLTTVPACKPLCFGGDSIVVETVVGHAELARRGLQAALEGLVRDGWLSPDDALALVPQLMRGNALKIFG
jgi:predicted TIM-barrel fold metal-dependent hydrolase